MSPTRIISQDQLGKDFYIDGAYVDKMSSFSFLAEKKNAPTIITPISHYCGKGDWKAATLSVVTPSLRDLCKNVYIKLFSYKYDY